MAARGQRQRGLTPYARLLCGAVGGLGLLLGIIAVFVTFNPAGYIALLVIGSIFSLVAIIGRMPTADTFAGSTRPPISAGNAALGELLESADPRVKRAVAEAVLQGEAAGAGQGGPLDTRDAALAVLLERDSIRRLADLLTRYGFDVSTGESAGQQGLGADLLVSRSAASTATPVPIELSSHRPDSPSSLQRLGSLAELLHSKAAVVVHTAARGPETPLPTVTPIGSVQVFSVHSARLADEAEIISAVQRAVALVDAAGAVTEPPTREPAPEPEERTAFRGADRTNGVRGDSSPSQLGPVRESSG